MSENEVMVLAEPLGQTPEPKKYILNLIMPGRPSDSGSPGDFLNALMASCQEQSKKAEDAAEANRIEAIELDQQLNDLHHRAEQASAAMQDIVCGRVNLRDLFAEVEKQLRLPPVQSDLAQTAPLPGGMRRVRRWWRVRFAPFQWLRQRFVQIFRGLGALQSARR